jgi:acyl-CoA dehydrogenase
LLAFEVGDRTHEIVALGGLGIGVALGFPSLGIGERRLRHQRAQARVVSLLPEEQHLLLGDRKVGAEPLQAIGNIDEPTLDQRAGHMGSVEGSLCSHPADCGTSMADPRPDVVVRSPGVAYPLFTAEHDELRASIRRFVDGEIRPFVDEWESAGHFPDSLFLRCGELGFLGLHYPARWGGSDGDLAAGLVFVEELARGSAAIAMALSVQTDMATPALGEFGTDAQRGRWLVPAIAGTKIAAIAITEPDAGSDVAGIRTRASRDGDGWRINGSKMYITNGVRADFLTLVVQTEPGSRHRGISLFLVDTDTPGVSVSRRLSKLGMHSSDTALIALDDVWVHHDCLLGGVPGHGFAQLMWQLQYERLAAAAASLGHADEALRQTVAFAAQRETFGRPIAHHQVIAHKLADAATDVESTRCLLYSTAWRVMNGEYPVMEISMAKKHAAQVQHRVIDSCLQIHGGAGYLEETPIARAYRDGRLNRIGGGTDEVMNEIIAKHLLGDT